SSAGDSLGEGGGEGTGTRESAGAAAPSVSTPNESASGGASTRIGTAPRARSAPGEAASTARAANHTTTTPRARPWRITRDRRGGSLTQSRGEPSDPSAREPDRPERKRAGRQRGPQRRFEVTGPELIAPLVLERGRPRQRRTGAFVVVGRHGVARAGDDFIGTLQRAVGRVLEV